MLRDFALELVSAPSNGATITLPGSAPPGRLTWAQTFATSQYVFYVLDDSLKQEWGVGYLTVGSPSTITRPTLVMGNSSGTTSRVNFSDTCRCFSTMPALAILGRTDGAIGRNYLLNGRFDFRQRGNGSFTSNGYTADRWFHSSAHSNGAFSDSLIAVTDAQRATLGHNAADYLYSASITGGTGAGDFDLIAQYIEKVHRLAGKTVTVSFYAYASAANMKIGIEAVQNFGTGGSPSPPVVSQGMGAVILTTGFARYVATFTLSTTAGKTLGANGDDFTGLNLWLSSGSTYNGTRASNIGIQTGTIYLWGVQIEASPAPSSVEQKSYPLEFAECRRFYRVIPTVQLSCYAPASGPVTAQWVSWGEPMRVTPTISQSGSIFGNATAATFTAATPAGSESYLTCSGAGVAYGVSTLSLSAEL